MTEADKIIRYIKRNRVSSTQVADALGKTGVMSGLITLSPDQFRVGKIRCIFAANNSNYDVHEQIRAVEEGEIVIVFTENCEGRAIFGDLVSKYLLLYKGAEALVVDGLVRDASRLKRENYPVWSRGVTPLGCVNAPAPPFAKEGEDSIRARLDGGVAVCDDGGVVTIPRYELDETMLDRLHSIELQEDIWYYCLNTLKWDTKRIVCDKDYLNEPNLLPDEYRAKLAILDTILNKKDN